jgi:hypothetical protein
MQVRLLGPVDVVLDGGPRPVPGLRRMAVLATLAQHAGLAAARRTHDVAVEAHALHGLALGYARSGRFGDAYPCFHQALALFGRVGDRVSQARIHSSLTWLAEREQRLTDALDHGRQAFDLLGAAGHAGQAMILDEIDHPDRDRIQAKLRPAASGPGG